MFDLVDAFSEDEAQEVAETKQSERYVPLPVGDQAVKLVFEQTKPHEEESTSRVGSKFVDLSSTRGITMRYELQGSKNAPKLLYLPGVTDKLEKDMTKGHIKRLAREFYTLACDLRNQGETTPCTWDVYVPQQTYVEDIVALIDAVFGAQEAIHVVGWGVGAVLGLALARAHPSRVLRLAVLSGGYWEAQTHLKVAAKGSAAVQQKIFGSDWPWIRDASGYATLGMQERCRRMLLHADSRRHSDQIRAQMETPFECVLEMFVRGEERSVTCPQSASLSVMALESMVYVEGTPNVEKIVTPTLIVHGMHDGMHSLTRARELKRRMPWAQFEVLDEGHVLINAAMPVVKEFLTTEANLPCGPVKPMQWDVSSIEVKVSPREAVQNIKMVQECEEYIPDRIPISYSMAIAMLEEVTAAYKRKAFQSKLNAGRSSGTEKDLGWLEDLCLKAQRPILERYGFDPTPSGIRASEDAIKEMYGEPEIYKKVRRIAALLGYPAPRKGLDGDIESLGSFRRQLSPSKLEPHEPVKTPKKVRRVLRGLPVFADLTHTRGIHMRYELVGEADSPKLLYIPGTTDDLRKDLTRTQATAFSDDFYTLTCDLRNQGLTKPYNLKEYVPLETHVEDLLALVDAMFGSGCAVHVVGWGFGAALALALARAHQDRVLGVALLAGGDYEPRPDIKDAAPRPGLVYGMPEQVFGKEWSWVHDLSSLTTLKTRERCRRTLLHADSRRQDETFRRRMPIPFEGMLDMFEMSEELSVMHNPDQHAYGVLSHMISMFVEGTEGVEELVRPVLIVHGQHDGMHSVERARRLHERMPWAEFQVLENEGHVMVSAAAPMVTEFLLKNFPRASLTQEQAVELQAELIAAYNTKAFQTNLHATSGTLSQELCLGIQVPIVSRFGFEPTAQGVSCALQELELLRDDPEVAARSTIMESLLRLSGEAPTIAGDGEHPTPYN